MRARRVVLNTVALTGGQLLTRFSGLVFVPLLPPRLGSAELAAYQLGQLLISYASVVALFGGGTVPLAVAHVGSHLARDAATLVLLGARFCRPAVVLRWAAQRALLVAGFPFFVQ